MNDNLNLSTASVPYLTRRFWCYALSLPALVVVGAVCLLGPSLAASDAKHLITPIDLSSNGFCKGGETLCVSRTTDKPAELLSNLAETLPAGKAKKFRVQISVVNEGNQ